MRVERIRGDVPAAEVQALTVRAFAEQNVLDPPSGALAETTETIAADFAADGGVLLRDDDGRLLAACRVRPLGAAWVVRRCAVEPARRRSGLGRRLIAEAEAWALDEGAQRVHMGVRDALPDSRAFWEGLGYRVVTHHGFWTELAHALTLHLADPDETQDLGRRLAADLRPGDVVVLSGPLGAGKTTLTQGIGTGLGVRGHVTSPTFVLARVHPGPLPLVHVDAYRLRDAGGRVELDDLDLDASLADSVTVVEWGDGLAEGLAESRLEIDLGRPEAEARTARIRAVGPRWSVFG